MILHHCLLSRQPVNNASKTIPILCIILNSAILNLVIRGLTVKPNIMWIYILQNDETYVAKCPYFKPVQLCKSSAYRSILWNPIAATCEGNNIIPFFHNAKHLTTHNICTFCNFVISTTLLYNLTMRLFIHPAKVTIDLLYLRHTRIVIVCHARHLRVNVHGLHLTPGIYP